MSSFFEIGGNLVECQTRSTSIPSPLSSPSSFRGAPTTLTVAQVQGQRKPKVAGGRKGEQTESKAFAKMIGSGMIRAGVAILLVPDPLPFVDEIVGGLLIGGGAVMVYYAES